MQGGFFYPHPFCRSARILIPSSPHPCAASLAPLFHFFCILVQPLSYSCFASPTSLSRLSRILVLGLLNNRRHITPMISHGDFSPPSGCRLPDNRSNRERNPQWDKVLPSRTSAISEYGEEGSFCTSGKSLCRGRNVPSPSNPRLDGGWSKLTLQSNIYSLTVQPRAGRWMHTAYRPLKTEWSLQMIYLLSTRNYKDILPQPSLHFYSIRIIKIAATIESFWQYRLGRSQWE